MAIITGKVDPDLADNESCVIYLVRHGETVWNKMSRLQGRLDSPLTPRGIQQAHAIGETLRHEIKDIRDVSIETSDLGRARETAKIIADVLGFNLPAMVLTPLLVEHDFGDWQGLTPSQVDELYPGARAERRSRRWSYTIPNGESYASVSVRAREWLSAPRYARTTIAVTHEMTSRTIQGLYLKLSEEETLARTHPHHRIYRLMDGCIDELPGQS